MNSLGGVCGPAGGRGREAFDGARAAGEEVAGESDGALRLTLPQHQDRGHLQVNETGLRSHLHL